DIKHGHCRFPLDMARWNPSTSRYERAGFVKPESDPPRRLMRNPPWIVKVLFSFCPAFAFVLSTRPQGRLLPPRKEKHAGKYQAAERHRHDDPCQHVPAPGVVDRARHQGTEGHAREQHEIVKALR